MHLVADCALRRGMGTFLGRFKRAGSTLESTHFTEAERGVSSLHHWSWRSAGHSKLVYVCEYQGLGALKKYSWRAKCLFRLGFGHLGQLILNPSPLYEDFL